MTHLIYVGEHSTDQVVQHLLQIMLSHLFYAHVKSSNTAHLKIAAGFSPNLFVTSFMTVEEQTLLPPPLATHDHTDETDITYDHEVDPDTHYDD